MQTISIISLPLKRSHNNHILSCFAENPKIVNSTTSDNLVLNVQCKMARFDKRSQAHNKSSFSDIPELSLQLGHKLSLNSLQEGIDIYFECLVDANPMPAGPIIWRLNEDILEPRQGTDGAVNLSQLGETVCIGPVPLALILLLEGPYWALIEILISFGSNVPPTNRAHCLPLQELFKVTYHWCCKRCADTCPACTSARLATSTESDEVTPLCSTFDTRLTA